MELISLTPVVDTKLVINLLSVVFLLALVPSIVGILITAIGNLLENQKD